MRYEDASTGAFQGSAPIANDDMDSLPAGSKSAATGNLISGEGTQTGSAGADSAAGAHITAIAGKSGEDSSFAGGKLSVSGEHGKLSVDAEGNYSYLANQGVENVRDRFTYTLADNQGNSDTAALIVEIGKTPVVIKADAQQVVVGPDGVVTLPPGVQLSDIMVVGRNLVVNLPDGTQMIIIDGAVFVPQLVLDGVSIPSTNVAALLIGQEPQPAAGETPPSSGGNFALPPPPLDPGVPLGDLLPPTEYDYIPPEPEEVLDELDSEPEVGPNPDALLDDDALEGGNPGGTGDDPDSVNVSGQLSGSGGDGVLSFDVLLTGAPDGFTYVSGGAGIVLIQQGGVTVLTVTVDSDGSYSVVQNAPIDHAAGGDENNQLFTINYSVTDEDGDSAFGTLTINVDDDTPIVVEGQVGGTVDEDGVPGGIADGPDDVAGENTVVNGSVASLFSAGADSPLTFGLSSNTSGLPSLTSNGVAVTYAVVGDTLTASAGGNPVFTLVVNADGSYTFTLLDQIDHPTLNGQAGDDTENDLSLALGSVIQATDADGDTVTAPANGLVIVVDDDTPLIGRTELQAPTLIVDESNLALNASGDFSVMFDGDVGADAPGSMNFAVSVVNGTDSGLVDVATGQSIFLFNNNGVVEGRVGGQNGAVAFTVSVNSNTGVVTLDQIRALEHPNAADPDDPVSPDATSIQLTASLIDADGDADSLTVDIGANLVFEDDGPSVTPTGVEPQLVVDESNLTVNNTQNFGDAFNEAFGADGPDGSGVSYELGINAGPTGIFDTATGLEVVLTLEGGAIVGRAGPAGPIVFTISVNANGDVTVDQLRAVIHPDPTNPDDSINIANDNLITLTATVTDGDGDTASATIGIGNNVHLEDDGPSANNDSDTTAAGVATGNVITGVGTAEGGANADDPGEDGFDTITNLVSNGTADSDNNPAGGFTVTGLYGTLQMGADGSYTYTEDAEAPGGVSDVFTYTYIDGDGDPATATLTINIPDAFPVLPDPDAVLLDDDALANGNPGGTDDDPDSQGLPGQLNGSGGNGDLDYNFTGDDTLPPGFTTNVVDASTVQILQGATVVLTITLNNETGAFNVVQNNPIDHLAGDDENNYNFSIGVEVEDADGDVEGATISINVDDDTPELQEVGAGAGVDVDETDAGSPAGFPISDTSAGAVINADALFGADGPAAVNATVYGLAITGGPSSGLQTAIGNFGITLVQIDGDTIQGQYQDGGTQVAFTIQMNANGSVTLTQNVPLEHLVDGAPGAPHNDTLDLTGLINATITITDGDGDTASASAPIGDNLVFFDDGPNAQVDGEASLDQLVLDETTPPGTETDGDSSPPGLVQTTANFANNFVAPVDFGADGPGTVAYSLFLSANGIGSGLYVIDPIDISAGDGDGYGQGAEITLSINGAGTLITGSAGGTDYFTISIDPVTGVVTFTQLDNIWHPSTASDDDTATLTTDVAANVQVVQTVTDSDGDFDTAAINVGAGVFHIEDDGPVATNDVDDIVSGGSSAVGNVITGSGTNAGVGNADDVGADTPGRVTSVSGVNSDSTPDGGGNLVVNGLYGVLTINVDGSYSYVRNDGAPGNVQDVFTYTLTDADGDSDTATLTINIGDAAPNLPDPVLVRLDDDALAGGNAGGTNDDPNSAGLPGQLNGTGGDGDLDYNFTGVDTVPVGFTVNPVNATTVQILQGATVVLTITLNNETGAFNVVQNNPIDHLAGDTENNYDFSIGVEVEDADGDVEPASITINVDDDTPVLQEVSAGDSVDLDETDAGSPAGFPISDTSTDPVIDFTALFGADGPAAVNSIVYGLTIVGGSPEPSGLATAIGNFPITLVQIDANTIQGQYTDGGTQVAFIIDINADGTVTLTQNVPLEHLVDGAPGAPHNDTLDLSGLINATVTITDFDFDSTSASAPIGDNLVFFDDGPDAQVDGQAALDTLVLDETRPVGTETDGDSNPAGLMTVQANFADNFVSPVDYGGDGPGTTVYSLVLSANGIGSGLFALDPTDKTAGDGDGVGKGAEITLSQVGNVITGSAGGTDYFTITINPATGVVTFTQLNNIWHANTASDDDTSTLTTPAAANVQVVQTVTDSDGDTDTAAINVGAGVFQIEDDGPTMGTIEDGTASNNPADGTSSGELNFDVGSDVPAIVASITADNTGITSGGKALVTNFSGNVLTAYQDSNGNGTYDALLDTTAVYTLTVNPAAGADGEWVFDLITPFDPTVVDTPIGGSTSFGAGPTGFQVLDDGGGNPLCVVSGYNVNAGFNQAAWLASGNTAAANLDSGGVNGSTAGWGIDNNNFDAGEFFNWDFGPQAPEDPDGPGPFVPPANPGMPNISFATFEFINYGAGDEMYYVVHYTDGTFDSGQVPPANVDAGLWTFNADPGKFIADIEMFTPDAAPGKVDLVSVGVTSTDLDETIDFNVTLTDADGDPVSGSFSVNVADGNTPSMALFAESSSSQDEQLQKSAANSNTLTLAAAIAAAGMGSRAAANEHQTNDLDRVSGNEHSVNHNAKSVDAFSAANDDGPAVSTLIADEPAGDSAPADSSSSSSADDSSANVLDDSAASAASEPSEPAANDDQGPVNDAAFVATAPAVAMVSAEALKAAAADGEAEGGAVEQVLADALGHGAAPTVDALLESLPGGGNGGHSGLADVASHGPGGVPGWDMGGSGAYESAAHMLFNVHAAMQHHDAVQPAVNG